MKNDPLANLSVEPTHPRVFADEHCTIKTNFSSAMFVQKEQIVPVTMAFVWPLFLPIPDTGDPAATALSFHPAAKGIVD